MPPCLLNPLRVMPAGSAAPLERLRRGPRVEATRAEAGPGSVTRALRPALLVAAGLGLLPFRPGAAPAGRWWCSLAALRSALVSAAALALLVVDAARARPAGAWRPSGAARVFVRLRQLHGPLLWAGTVLWVWRRPPQLITFFDACRRHEVVFGALDLRSSARYVRRFVTSILVIEAFYVVMIFVHTAEVPTWRQLLSLIPLLCVYGGVIFWLIIFIGCCWCLQEALAALDGRLQEALDGRLQEALDGRLQEALDGRLQEALAALDGRLQEALDGRPGAAVVGSAAAPRLCRLVRQHGQLCRLVELLSETFGGFVAFYLCMLQLDVALTAYLNLRALSAPAGGGSALPALLLKNVLTPVPLVLLRLAAAAGDGVGRQTRRAAGLLRRRLPVAERHLTELLHLLEGQQAAADLAGYFTLDNTFFVQSMKDIITLVIVMAQFELA
ncbi:hypothetical protein FJT64_019686 [Amphibalanus amphitrite]|uniref:Gustatory receptor n=1 Tax=Amphibalanus amphitrite TaxID=1232801 RepID=A0A6A4WQV4_AMPAM|nr:hypothetical protein FJT64_019686 [Amphibalanus amphitrite]